MIILFAILTNLLTWQVKTVPKPTQVGRNHPLFGGMRNAPKYVQDENLSLRHIGIDNMSMENYIEYKKTDAQTKLLLKYKKET